jgi:hypothetical protein
LNVLRVMDARANLPVGAVRAQESNGRDGWHRGVSAHVLERRRFFGNRRRFGGCCCMDGSLVNRLAEAVNPWVRA